MYMLRSLLGHKTKQKKVKTEEGSQEIVSKSTPQVFEPSYIVGEGENTALCAGSSSSVNSEDSSSRSLYNSEQHFLHVSEPMYENGEEVLVNRLGGNAPTSIFGIASVGKTRTSSRNMKQFSENDGTNAVGGKSLATCNVVTVGDGSLTTEKATSQDVNAMSTHSVQVSELVDHCSKVKNENGEKALLKIRGQETSEKTVTLDAKTLFMQSDHVSEPRATPPKDLYHVSEPSGISRHDDEVQPLTDAFVTKTSMEDLSLKAEIPSGCVHNISECFSSCKEAKYASANIFGKASVAETGTSSEKLEQFSENDGINGDGGKSLATCNMVTVEDGSQKPGTHSVKLYHKSGKHAERSNTQVTSGCSDGKIVEEAFNNVYGVIVRPADQVLAPNHEKPEETNPTDNLGTVLSAEVSARSPVISSGTLDQVPEAYHESASPTRTTTISIIYSPKEIDKSVYKLGKSPVLLGNVSEPGFGGEDCRNLAVDNFEGVVSGNASSHACEIFSSPLNQASCFNYDNKDETQTAVKSSGHKISCTPTDEKPVIFLEKVNHISDLAIQNEEAAPRNTFDVIVSGENSVMKLDTISSEPFDLVAEPTLGKKECVQLLADVRDVVISAETPTQELAISTGSLDRVTQPGVEEGQSSTRGNFDGAPPGGTSIKKPLVQSYSTEHNFDPNCGSEGDHKAIADSMDSKISVTIRTENPDMPLRLVTHVSEPECENEGKKTCTDIVNLTLSRNVCNPSVSCEPSVCTAEPPPEDGGKTSADIMDGTIPGETVMNILGIMGLVESNQVLKLFSEDGEKDVPDRQANIQEPGIPFEESDQVSEPCSEDGEEGVLDEQVSTQKPVLQSGELGQVSEPCGESREKGEVDIQANVRTPGIPSEELKQVSECNEDEKGVEDSQDNSQKPVPQSGELSQVSEPCGGNREKGEVDIQANVRTPGIPSEESKQVSECNEDEKGVEDSQDNSQKPVPQSGELSQVSEPCGGNREKGEVDIQANVRTPGIPSEELKQVSECYEDEKGMEDSQANSQKPVPQSGGLSQVSEPCSGDEEDDEQLILSESSSGEEDSSVSSLGNLLFKAVRNLRVKDCLDLLGDVEDVDARGENGDTLLELAVELGKLDWAQKLLGMGSNPNLVHAEGHTALLLAKDMCVVYPENLKRKVILRLVKLASKLTKKECDASCVEQFTGMRAVRSKNEGCKVLNGASSKECEATSVSGGNHQACVQDRKTGPAAEGRLTAQVQNRLSVSDVGAGPEKSVRDSPRKAVPGDVMAGRHRKGSSTACKPRGIDGSDAVVQPQRKKRSRGTSHSGSSHAFSPDLNEENLLEDGEASHRVVAESSWSHEMKCFRSSMEERLDRLSSMLTEMSQRVESLSTETASLKEDTETLMDDASIRGTAICELRGEVSTIRGELMSELKEMKIESMAMAIGCGRQVRGLKQSLDKALEGMVRRNDHRGVSECGVTSPSEEDLASRPEVDIKVVETKLDPVPIPKVGAGVKVVESKAVPVPVRVVHNPPMVGVGVKAVESKPVPIPVRVVHNPPMVGVGVKAVESKAVPVPAPVVHNPPIVGVGDKVVESKPVPAPTPVVHHPCTNALLAMTRCFGSKDDVEWLREYYHDMLSLGPLIAPMLTFIKANKANNVMIIVDFTISDIGVRWPRLSDLDGRKKTPSRPKIRSHCSSRTVYVAAKVHNEYTEDYVVGCLTVGLARLAVYLAFMNKSKPYVNGSTEMMKYAAIVKEAEDLLKRVGPLNMDWYLRNAIGWMSKEAQEVALISAVPGIIAHYGLEGGVEILSKQLPSLLQFYQEYVVSKFK
ncbi:uncharacterized protein LOC124172690 [Ischnura elegans]|uniref:uncharacterized protein LOC124172690 n=1 Tax=Ischnura elegans TaxID=197161 RepID=UPI001ED8A7A8|nr:uncharacterized protein LOC124172690 [Ischnura elegans]